jgi:hypothetical protein
MNLSDYLKNQVINHLLRNQAFTPPATLYLALFTAAPSSSGGGTEVSGGSYARQVIALDAPSTPGVTQNTSDIVFPTPTANWGTITHGAVFDAVTAGNMLLFGAMVQARTVLSGGSFKVLDSEFDFSLS